MLNQRTPIGNLYSAYFRLYEIGDWKMETLFSRKLNGSVLDTLAFRTKKKGNAIYLISGIHGEEPAGPIAIAENIDYIMKLGDEVPMVVLPLCNPFGYYMDWRYPNERRDQEKGDSVGDCSHYLLDETGLKPRLTKPVSKEALALTSHVFELSKDYPPFIALDLHEDEDMKAPYIYSHSAANPNDPIANHVVSVLKGAKIPLQMKGKTRFGENIVDGIVKCSKDGSIDEFLASEEVYANGPYNKPASKSVVVVETPALLLPLRKRVEAHGKIIQSLKKYWKELNY